MKKRLTRRTFLIHLCLIYCIASCLVLITWAWVWTTISRRENENSSKSPGIQFTLQSLRHCLGLWDSDGVTRTCSEGQSLPFQLSVQQLRSILKTRSRFSDLRPTHSDHPVLRETPLRRFCSGSNDILPITDNSLLLIPRQPHRPKLQWTKPGEG